eukprot:6170699-Pleurochrysis_carterae.AAC.2
MISLTSTTNFITLAHGYTALQTGCSSHWDEFRISTNDWLHANEGRRKNYEGSETFNCVMACVAATPKTSVVYLFKGILHAQRSAELAVTACDLGQAFVKCPESVPVQAATSQTGWRVFCLVTGNFCACGRLSNNCEWHAQLI